MLRITPEHGTFRVARQVTFDASRRFPRTAGGLGCSATISGLGGVFIAGSDIDQPSCWAEKPRSGSGEGLVPFLSLQSIAITQSRRKMTRASRCSKGSSRTFTARRSGGRGGPGRRSPVRPSNDRRRSRTTLRRVGAVVADIGRIDPDPFALDESPCLAGDPAGRDAFPINEFRFHIHNMGLWTAECTPTSKVSGFEGDALGRNWGGIRDRCGKTSEIGTDYLGATAPVHRSQAAGGLGCAPRICTTRITCSATSVFRLPSVSSRHL